MSFEKRIILIEKITPWDYVDQYGNRVWLNKYGDIIKTQTSSGFFIVASNRNAIKTRWSVETLQDLQAYHGIDIESELTTILSQELGQAIDRGILNTIMNPHTFEI